MKQFSDLKILFWDIETLPYVSFTWGLWKQNVNASQIVKNTSIICGSYKWLGEQQVHTASIGDNVSTFRKDPYSGGDVVAKKLIKVLNQADFIVAHNGDRFDYAKLKGLSVIHNLGPFKVRKVDTLKMAKATGVFPGGNSLKSLAKVLGVPQQKQETSMEMWADIALRSDREALKKMERYCEQDVRVLEAVFMRLWPHCEGLLPNIPKLLGKDSNVLACDRCGSTNVVKNGRYIKNVQMYQKYQCKFCGANFLGRKTL